MKKTWKEIKEIAFEIVKKSKSKKINSGSYNLGIYDAIRLMADGREDELLEMMIKK